MSIHLDDELMPWVDDAACAGEDGTLFFPDRGESAHPAKMICSRCVVRADCLAYALDTGVKYGIWGGLTEKERGSHTARRRAHLYAVQHPDDFT